MKTFENLQRSLKMTKTEQCDRPMDGPTDQRTDRPSYRDAWTHLKIASFDIQGIGYDP